MNNIEEAKKWFKYLFQGCYLKKLDKYPDYIFWIYDKNLIRQRKFSKITGIEKFNLNLSDGEWIFKQDKKNGYFYIKYTNYWLFLESNFNFNYNQVKNLTTEVVNELLNSKEYTTKLRSEKCFHEVNELLNNKEYTTSDQCSFYSSEMNEILNCKEYTTKTPISKDFVIVNEILNSKNIKIIK